MPADSNISSPTRLRKLRRIIVRVALIAVVLGVLYYFFQNDGIVINEGTTFVVKRGPLEVTVLESGTIEALESTEIKSEVEGETKILSIVDEGYTITEEDVTKGLVLVELDSTDLVERQVQQELQFQNAVAAYTEAREQFTIQKNQNDSDIMSSELAVKFALMDLEKYLGADVAAEVILAVGLDKVEAEVRASADIVLPDLDADLAAPVTFSNTPAGSRNGDAAPVEAPPADAAQTAENAQSAKEDTEGGASADVSIEAPGAAAAPTEETAAQADVTGNPVAPEATAVQRAEIDFDKYTDADRLGNGEAGQRLRDLEDKLVLAEKEVGQAQSKMAGTQRLFEKEFVTRDDLEDDEMALRRSEIALASADTSKNLFIRYEFPKQAQKLLSDYEEALRKLQRTRQQAVSRLAQAEAKLKSAQASYALQAQRRRELQEQIAKCVIRATTPGLVVYGARERRYYDDVRIEEGATIRERQPIITIPNTTVMSAEAKIHEAYIERIRKEQRARIRVDAHPDEVLEGDVYKIGILPDAQNRWMNPDLKVYNTTVRIDGLQDWLKPGLSAQIEIIVDKLEEVVQVPVQAVSQENGDRVCYVVAGLSPQRRVVETGAFNDSFIEIKSGLEVDERVMLRRPGATDSTETQNAESDGADKADKKKGGDKEGGGRRRGGGEESKSETGAAAAAPAAS